MKFSQKTREFGIADQRKRNKKLVFEWISQNKLFH